MHGQPASHTLCLPSTPELLPGAANLSDKLSWHSQLATHQTAASLAMHCGAHHLNSAPVAADFWSLYWSAVTFATVGYGDLHAYNVAEAIFCTLSIFTNIVINAWITGKAALPRSGLLNTFPCCISITHTQLVCPAPWVSLGGILRNHSVHDFRCELLPCAFTKASAIACFWVAKSQLLWILRASCGLVAKATQAPLNPKP